MWFQANLDEEADLVTDIAEFQDSIRKCKLLRVVWKYVMLFPHSL